MSIFHTACHTRGFVPAIHDPVEGAELFWRLCDAMGPRLVSLCVMPDHVHLITHVPARDDIRATLSGYTRWRHHRRGGSGPLFAKVPEPLERRGGAKVLRDQRYVEINPCRAGLVADPLAWPFSTWRDRMGLAWPAVRPAAQDVARWHAYATRDDHVQADGLPYQYGDRDPHDVVAAVSSLTRRPVAALRQRGPARTLLVASLKWLTPLSNRAVGAFVGVSDRAVRRVRPRDVEGLLLVQRIAGDPRFASLDLPDTRAYRRRQLRNAAGPGPGWD